MPSLFFNTIVPSRSVASCARSVDRVLLPASYTLTSSLSNLPSFHVRGSYISPAEDQGLLSSTLHYNQLHARTNATMKFAVILSTAAAFAAAAVDPLTVTSLNPAQVCPYRKLKIVNQIN